MTPRSLRILIVGLVALVGLAAAAPFVWRAVHGEAKAKNPIAVDPLPRRLFPAAEVAPIEAQERAAIARADIAAASYLRAHPVRNDAAFSRFAAQTVPRPPPISELRMQLPLVRRLEASRSPARRAAVDWLFLHGKKDVWKLYLRQYKDLVGKQRGHAAKVVFKQTLDLANTINTTLKGSIREPHPLQLDHALQPIVPHPGATHAETVRLDRTKYSYPSNHTNISVALATVLASFEPHREAEYDWMASEISYSRLVAGVHFPQDLVAGAFEGRLVGDYEVHFARAT